MKFIKSLSAGASLITKLAMVVATYGTFAGTSLLANVSNAAFGTLCGQTATAFIENDANLGRTFKAAASTDTLKAVVRSAATAGIVHGLTSAFSDVATDAAANTTSSPLQSGGLASTNVVTSTASKATEIASKTFSECVQTALIHSVADTVVSSVMDGIPLDKLLSRGLMSAAINASAAYTAGGIGAKYNKGEMHYLTHKVSHALLGGAAGVLTALAFKQNITSGAMGGAIGGVSSEIFMEATCNLMEEGIKLKAENPKLSDAALQDAIRSKVATNQRIAQLVATSVAFASGADAHAASSSAHNAVTNNFAMAIPAVVAFLGTSEGVAIIAALGLTGAKITSDLIKAHLPTILRMYRDYLRNQANDQSSSKMDIDPEASKPKINSTPAHVQGAQILITPVLGDEVVDLPGYTINPEAGKPQILFTPIPDGADDMSILYQNDGKKIRIPGLSGKEGAKDVPSWVLGERPFIGESGKDFAKRLLEAQCGQEKYDTGPTSDFNKIKKYGDRSFTDPK